MKEIVKKRLIFNNQYRFISNVFSDEIYIIFYNNSYKAISGFCPHFGGPLTLNMNGEFHCYWHDWKFDVHSLTCKNFSFKKKLKEYKVKDLGDSLEVFL